MTRSVLVVSILTSLLAGCAPPVVDGSAVLGVPANADLPVQGDSHTSFDTSAKNALSDVMAFWRIHYPQISGGRSLPPLKGGLFSIDGAEVVQSGQVLGGAAREACVAKRLEFIVNNGAYCTTDDSIVWDRNPNHLLGVLTNTFGPLLFALVFAHEFGHAIQARLGIFNQNLPVIFTESQADCAAGAFLADVLAGRAAHFRVTPAQLDRALLGYLQVRDSTPNSPADITHGDGFDRLSAIDDGLLHGPRMCYSSTYFNRQFTERSFVTDTDYRSGGNETLAQVLNPNQPSKDSTAGGLEPDLNRFWSAAAKLINKAFTPVQIAQADHPKCGASPTSEFGYCPDDNTVYYSADFAAQAYNSLSAVGIDPSSKDVTFRSNQAGDYALGTLFAVGWGMAVRHQLFNLANDGADALIAAACYAGAYSKDINLATSDATHQFILSPPDLDEATSAMLTLVGSDRAYGARGTTGLQRIQAFVKGYTNGLSAC